MKQYFPGRESTYDKRPTTRVAGRAWRGWADVGANVAAGADRVVLVECYPGVDVHEVADGLRPSLRPDVEVLTPTLFRPAAETDRMVAPWLGSDPVFGRMAPLVIADWLDDAALADARERVRAASGRVLVVGPGASLVAESGTLAYADLTRWEAQGRQRAGLSGNLGAENAGSPPGLIYKRCYFVDWRAGDRLKRDVWPRVGWFIDTTARGDPRLASGADVRDGLAALARRPFRLVPFFDPAPWGGQWMREVCALDEAPPNFGWCFDCVPEENSIILTLDGGDVELPAQDLVMAQPRALLGDPVHARFGAEFPIRFDFLDTMGGGNLSLQVHPLTEYIQEQFGMHYTQDESYYLLDAEPGAHVFLGLRDGVDPAAFEAALRAAARDPNAPFDADRFVGKYPARKHDHFLIPAGTLHCSGAGSMVLEISATPYIFTFKQWDWARTGLDGHPRPIHIDHGMKVIQWDRKEAWVRRNLINRVLPLSSGDGWRSERTGLHEREFIETVRHWFTAPCPASTGGIEDGSVHVLNLVEGEDAVIDVPGADPFAVHYAETVVIPAAVGDYTVRPGPRAERTGQECGTITASVRFRA